MRNTERMIMGSIMQAPSDSPMLLDALLHLSKNDFDNFKDFFDWITKRFYNQQKIDADSLLIAEDNNTFLKDIYECLDSIHSYHSLPELTHRLKNEVRLNSLKRYYQECLSICTQDKTACDALDELLNVSNPPFIADDLKKGRTLNELAAQFAENYTKPFEHGELTGLSNLDELLNKEGNGIKNGSLLVITGGTKQGKSALATTIFSNRLTTGFSSLCFTMEIDGIEFITNMIAQKANIHRSRLVKKDMSVCDKIADACASFAAPNNIVYDKENMTIEFIVSMSRLEAKKAPVKTIMIDYLTLIKQPSLFQNSRENWGHVVKSLRHLAKELNCVVILLSQVNRNAEKRENKRPIMTDVTETSQLQYDCHLMLGTYVDKRKIEGKPKQMEVNIMLNRNGAQHERVYFDFEGGNLTPKSKELGELYNSLLETEVER